MNIVVDENIPLRTVQTLHEMGHTVKDIRPTSDKGVPDDEVWTIAQRSGSLFITTDRGFTEHRAEEHYGILIIRLRQPNQHKIHQRVMQAISQFTAEEWPGLVVIMRDM